MLRRGWSSLGPWLFSLALLAFAPPAGAGELPHRCGTGLRSPRGEGFTPPPPVARLAAARGVVPIEVPGATVHTTQHFRVLWGPTYDRHDPQWGDPDGDGVPTWVQELGAALEKSLAAQRALGFPDPYGLVDYYLDAYVGNTGLTIDGAAVTISTNYYAYTEIDRDHRVAYFVFGRDFSRHTGDELGVLRATAAHELFHAVQRAFGYPWDDEVLVPDPRWARETWWFEATATWVEELIYPEVDDYVRYAQRLLKDPETSLTFADGSREYGAAIFPGYLWLRHGGSALWGEVFGAAYRQGLEAALDTALRSRQGRTLLDVVAAFWALAANPESTWPDGAKFRAAGVPRLLRVTDALPLEVEPPAGFRPGRFGASLVKLPLAPGGLWVSLPAADEGTAWRVAATVAGSGLALVAAPSVGEGSVPLLASDTGPVFAAVVNVSDDSGPRGVRAAFAGEPSFAGPGGEGGCFLQVLGGPVAHRHRR